MRWTFMYIRPYLECLPLYKQGGTLLHSSSHRVTDNEVWSNVVQITSLHFLNTFRKQKLLAREEPFNSRKRKNLNIEVVWRDKNTKEVNLEKKNGRGRLGKKRSIRRSGDMTVFRGDKWKVWIWSPTWKNSEDGTLAGVDRATSAETCVQDIQYIVCTSSHTTKLISYANFESLS